MTIPALSQETSANAAPATTGSSVWLTIDPRSAGLFRIALGLLLLLHGWQRWRVWDEFYSPNGFVTPELLRQQQEIPYFPTLLTWLEVIPYGPTIFGLIAIGTYAMLTLGWKTSWATLGSLCLFSTLIHRNPYLVIGADEVIGSLLLWSLLLPLGTRFSIDQIPRWHNTGITADRVDEPSLFPVVAVFGLLAQLSLIYFASAWQKTGPTWWADGTALNRVLAISTYRLPGADLLQMLPPMLLKVLTRSVLIVEYALPVLILSPWKQTMCHRVALAGILGFHAGISAVLETGLFSVTMMVASLLLISAADWMALSQLTNRRGDLGDRQQTKYCSPKNRDRDQEDLEPVPVFHQVPNPLPVSLVKRSQVNGSPQSSLRIVREIAAVFLLCGFIQENWNRNFAPLGRTVHVESISWPWRFAGAAQRWFMFAPDPPQFEAQLTILHRVYNLGDTESAEATIWSSVAGSVDPKSRANVRRDFLWKLFLSRAAVMSQAPRETEGVNLRMQICRWFEAESARQPNLPRFDAESIEMWLKLVPTDRGQGIAQAVTEACVARHPSP